MRTKSWGTRWEYERTRKIAVFAIGSEVGNPNPVIIQELEAALREFSLPLNVIDGNLKHNEDLAQIQALLGYSIKDNKIDYDKFEKELRKVRKEGHLPYGIVILVDKNTYEFYHPREQSDQAIYGVGVPDGLVILRYTHREAGRHEFGHMLGIGRHHIGCGMDYSCASAAFCNQCKRQIEEMWREEINQGR